MLTVNPTLSDVKHLEEYLGTVDEIDHLLDTINNLFDEISKSDSISEKFEKVSLLSLRDTFLSIKQRAKEVNEFSYSFISDALNKCKEAFNSLHAFDEPLFKQFDLVSSIEKYTGGDAAVIIPEGIITIRPYAFSNNTNIESVTIPSTVEHIGENAFAGCCNLKHIYFSKGLFNTPTITIDSGAFANTGIESISLPSVKLGFNVFGGCDLLKHVEIDNILDTSRQMLNVDYFKVKNIIGWDLSTDRWFSRTPIIIDFGNQVGVNIIIGESLRLFFNNPPQKIITTHFIKITLHKNAKHISRNNSIIDIILHKKKLRQWKRSIVYLCQECGHEMKKHELKYNKTFSGFMCPHCDNILFYKSDTKQ